MKSIFYIVIFLLQISSVMAHREPVVVGNQLAGVEIYDRTEGRPLTVYWHKGQAFVVGKPGNEYQITVRNYSGRDLLAVTSVDGVNVITGETASPNQSGYVIDPNETVEVKGWRKSLSRTAAFYFTALSNSYATRTGRPDNVGVIGVALFRRKDDSPIHLSQPAPNDRVDYAEGLLERNTAGAGARAKTEAEAPSTSTAQEAKRDSYRPGIVPAPRQERLGTGHGRGESSQASYTSFERATSSPEEVIAIHYDSYANLVARGVIRPSPRREPTPFPGQFVPDPWR